YEQRLKEIAELTLDQIKRQMALIDTFDELHRLVKDLEARRHGPKIEKVRIRRLPRGAKSAALRS
ncbi:MAG: hypothetical protein P8129_16790, partial [Anaerolineae bacterium]